MKIKLQMCRLNTNPLITAILFKVLLWSTHSKKECWFYQSVSQTHRHVSLALWSYRNAFVVWRVGVRLGSHTLWIQEWVCTKMKDMRWLYPFYISFSSPDFFSVGILPVFPIQKLICNEMTAMEKVLSLHFWGREHVSFLWAPAGLAWPSHCFGAPGALESHHFIILYITLSHAWESSWPLKAKAEFKKPRCRFRVLWRTISVGWYLSLV